jgi:hypothetical protein
LVRWLWRRVIFGSPARNVTLSRDRERCFHAVYVCSWPKADIPRLFRDVRFSG